MTIQIQNITPLKILEIQDCGCLTNPLSKFNDWTPLELSEKFGEWLVKLCITELHDKISFGDLFQAVNTPVLAAL